MTKEEYQRCIDSPAYFINNYLLIKDKDGNWRNPEPVTDEEIREAMRKAHKEWKRYRDMVHTRRAQQLMEMFPNVFEGKEILIYTEGEK